MIKLINRYFYNKCYSYGMYVGNVKTVGFKRPNKHYVAYNRDGERLGSTRTKEEAYDLVFGN